MSRIERGAASFADFGSNSYSYAEQRGTGYMCISVRVIRRSALRVITTKVDVRYGDCTVKSERGRGR